MSCTCHNTPPEVTTKEALRLLDAAPIFEPNLLALGRWVADYYYCAPLGEVLRTMAPLTGEVRRTRVWGLTDKGRDVSRQLLMGEPGGDPAVEILRAMEHPSALGSHAGAQVSRREETHALS